MEEDAALDISMSRIISELDHGNIIISNRTILTLLTFTTSSIGIALSTIAIALLIVTASLFAEWRQNYKNQLLIQFMVARFFFTMARYFYDVTKVFDIHVRHEFFEDLDMFVLFYTEMALLSWMVVFTKHMYDTLVKLFDVEHPRLWKVSLAAWLSPCLGALVFFILYVLKNKQLFLYLVYLIVIKWPIIFTIAVLLILTVKSIINVNKSRTENNLRIVIVMVILIFIFCIQQIVIDTYKLVVMIICYKTDEMPYILYTGLVIFNIGSLYHCAFSILFWLFGNVQTRKLWKFKSMKHKAAQTSLSLRLSTK